MELAEKLLCVLAGSSLWLTGSGLVLWICLRSRRQLSPGTRAAASFLVVLQGWIWIGIPVQIDASWIKSKRTDFQAPRAAPIVARQLVAVRPPASGLSITVSSVSAPKFLAVPVVAAIWICGIAVILWRSLRGFVALYQMVRTLQPAPVEWQSELTALCGQLKIGSPIVLKISNVATPMLVQTWGFACVVFPAWLWESCTPEQRTSILLHELAHYQRRDIWRQLVVRLLVLPHWFNPVAWWAARQFEAASEAACDEAACGNDLLQAISYSKALLILNERMGIRYAHSLAVSGGSLTERIRRILHPEFRKESQMSRFLILSVMIVLAGLSTIRIQAADPSPPSQNASAQAPVVSLLPNGGFEELEEKTGDPQSWFGTRVMPAAGHFLLSVSPSIAHGGQRSAAVAIGDKHPDLQIAYNWTADAQGWQPGETYELSGWIKVENAERSAVIMAQFLNEGGMRILGGATTEKTCPITGTAEWTRVSTRFVVPEGTRVLRIRAGLPSKGNLGAKAWFDDLSLVKVAN